MAMCFQKAILESADPKKELFIFKTPTKNIKVGVRLEFYRPISNSVSFFKYKQGTTPFLSWRGY